MHSSKSSAINSQIEKLSIVLYAWIFLATISKNVIDATETNME